MVVRFFVKIKRISTLFLTPSATLQGFTKTSRAIPPIPCSVGVTNQGSVVSLALGVLLVPMS